MHKQVFTVLASHHHELEFRTALQNIGPRVDGLEIMAPELESKQTFSITNERLPVVILNTHVNTEGASAINLDNLGDAGLDGAREGSGT